jgi:hypothetical protein
MPHNLFGLIACLFFFQVISYGQPTNLANYDYNYSTNIQTVIIRPYGSVVGFPMTYLNSGRQLELLFDDLDGDFVFYKYRIVQCDANWNPSQLSEIEYLQGFNDQEIRDYAYSTNTRVNYTTYHLVFPNDLLGVTKSGNYLIHVYKDNDNEPALTRRFVVSEQVFNIGAMLTSDLRAGKTLENQRIDLTLNPTMRIPDPMSQVRVAILKNGTWNTRPLLTPKYIRNEELSFDYLDEVSFPGGKEFRYVDIRSVRRPSYKIENLERFNNRTEVFLRTESLEGNAAYSSYPDLGGSYLIQNLDRPDADDECDYFLVHFYLNAPNKLASPVYVLGQFNEWGHRDDIEPMTYVPEKKYYTTSILLKQGYYDYYYAEKTNKGFDARITEGNSFETSNIYQIIAYYRAYGERWDRVAQFWSLGTPVSGALRED